MSALKLAVVRAEDGRHISAADGERCVVMDRDYVGEYLRDCVRRGLRPRTVEEYGRRLRAFEAEHGDVSTVTRGDVEAWLDRFETAQTRHNVRSTLVGYWGWLLDSETDAVSRNVPRSVGAPRLPKRLPRPISTADLSEVMRLASRRERAFVALAAFGGLRTCEIAPLRVEDVDLVGGWLVVVDGKGGKSRTVPVHAEVRAALEALPMPKTGAVFRTAWGIPRRHNVGQSITRAFDRAGVVGSAHRLRHWFGTQVARQDFRAARELLGHSSFVTTAGYCAWQSDAARDAVEGLPSLFASAA